MFANASLKLRLALLIGIAAVFGAVVISRIANNFVRQQIERDQTTLLENVASGMESRLAQDMNARSGEIVFLSKLDRLRDPKFAADQKQALLERMKASYPHYAWIGVTDSSGNIIAGTAGNLVGKSVAKRDWFLRGRERLSFGDAHDAFLLAKLLPKPQWDDLPLRLVDVSAPILDDDGQLLGVICGHLSLDWAFEARNRMIAPLARDQLDLIVLNRDGKLLMGTPQLPSLKLELGKLAAVTSAVPGQPGSALDIWPDQKRYLTVAAHEVGFGNYPGMAWTVVVRKPELLAFAPAAQLSNILTVLGVLFAVVFASILWFILSRHLRPLEDISMAAQRIGLDDTSAAIPQLKGRGELAVFAQSLTGLVHRLQQQNADLRLADRVFAESGQGIFITDASNRIVRVNTTFERITGFREADVLGKDPKMLQSGDSTPALYRAMWDALNTAGTWQGEVWNRARDGRVYPEWLAINTLYDASGAVSHYIAIFDDITEKKDYERRLVHLANYDTLTDLPNRNLMQQQVQSMIERVARENTSLALMFVDLDKFKHINDTLGHPAGDLVLSEAANRFRMEVPDGDVLARWGGDEFVLAMPGVDSMAAAALAKRLTETLQRPFNIEGGRYHIGMSIGIAMYPIDGRSVDALLRCADTAMYKAKHDGSNLYRFYESSMNAGVERFLKIDNALRHSVERGGEGLSLAFQPQFSADGQRIVSAEALVRWTHPELGTVSPGQFIPVAEETGLILPLGRWIIAEAMRSQASLVAHGCRPLPLSINCSAHQLRDVTMADTFHTEASQHHVAPANLLIEVTESAIMSDERHALMTLDKLRSRGYRISIDDFGTGYSCLNYIQKIRPAEIKIDQSFVGSMLQDENSRNIVAFTIGLAKSMDMEVVAEGVETEAQRDALQAMGNVKLQGYLLGRPMPLADLQRLLLAQ